MTEYEYEAHKAYDNYRTRHGGPLWEHLEEQVRVSWINAEKRKLTQPQH